MPRSFTARPGRGLLPGGEEASEPGGGERTRTPNPLLAKQVRCQLRHAPGGPGVRRGPRSPHGHLTGSVTSAQRACSARSDSTLRQTAKPAAARSTRAKSFFTTSSNSARTSGGGSHRSVRAYRRSSHGGRRVPPRRAPGEDAATEEGPLEGVVSVHPAATEPGDLARRVEAGDRLAEHGQRPPVQGGLDPPPRPSGVEVGGWPAGGG